MMKRDKRDRNTRKIVDKHRVKTGKTEEDEGEIETKTLTEENFVFISTSSH